MDYLEASPDPGHPLKGLVAAVLSGAAIAFATALGKKELRLMNPLAAVVPCYLALGFALANPAGETQYCWWKIP
jgi:drug/metabolite transporter (DMT)-like permease